MAKEPQRWVPNERTGGEWKRESELTLDDLEAIESHYRKLREIPDKNRSDQPRVRRKRSGH